jgi:hypothetical protein
MPVILATWEAESGRSQFKVSPAKKKKKGREGKGKEREERGREGRKKGKEGRKK